MEILLGIFLAVLATWLAEDLKPWLNKAKFSLINAAVFLAPSADREACKEAWMADADDIEGNLKQIIWAFKLSLASVQLHFDAWRDNAQADIAEFSDEYVTIDGIPFSDIQANAKKTSGRGYITLDELDGLEVGDLIKVSTAINTDNFILKITGKDDDDDIFMNESFWLITNDIRGDIIHAIVDNDLLFPDYHGMTYGDIVRLEKRCVINIIKKQNKPPKPSPG